MRKRNIALWALTPVAVALVLSGCGSGSDNDLAVDNNAQSCSVVSSSGSAVVVGSGVAGDPADRVGHRAAAARRHEQHDVGRDDSQLRGHGAHLAKPSKPGTRAQRPGSHA